MTELQRADINKLIALAVQRRQAWLADPEKYETVLAIYSPVIERMKRMMNWSNSAQRV